MKFLRKIILYTRRHLDFIVLDLLTFILAYFLSVQLRKSLDIRITHAELFLQFGIVAFFVYFAVLLVGQNLSGILARSLPREIKAIIIQMIATWSIFTVILYLIKTAQDFSRAIYISTFLFCTIAILAERTIWKCVIRYSRLHEKEAPKVLIVSEKNRCQHVLESLLPGCYENVFQISAVVTNRAGEGAYKDWYPCFEGLEHVTETLKDYHVQDAYVELDNPEEEKTTICELLESGIVVHRSLGGSHFNYASQYLDTFGGKSVITINDTQPSLVSRVDETWTEFLKRRARRNDKKL